MVLVAEDTNPANTRAQISNPGATPMSVLGRLSQMTKGTMVTSLITQLQNGTFSRLLLGVFDVTVTLD